MNLFHLLYEKIVLYFTFILYYHSRRKSMPATHIAEFALAPLSLHDLTGPHTGWVFFIYCAKLPGVL